MFFKLAATLSGCAARTPRTTHDSNPLAAAPAPTPADCVPSVCAPAVATPPAVIEPLESRQFLSATLSVTNSDVLPGFERMIFNRIGTPDADFPNYVKDRGALKLTNTGDQTLTFSSVKIDGPYMILGQAPTAIAPGKSAVVIVQFTATEPPPFTSNQTAGFDNQDKAGAYIGKMTLQTNDPNTPSFVETLAGWYQTQSEHDQEPSLQTLVNLIADYKTDFAPAGTVHLEEPDDSRVLYGEEVDSAYWQAADSSKGVSIRQLATFHTQGDPVRLSWYVKGNGATKQVLTTEGLSGQMFLPFTAGTKKAAASSFSPGASTFGFKIDNEWSDDSLNTARPTGGGHHVRFYPARDHDGNLISNAYFMVMDYSQVEQGSIQNYDFQDNVYLVFNLKPAGN